MKVAILYGGPSSEHDVSVSSARNVLAAIDRTKFEVTEVFIDKEGQFNIDGASFNVPDGVRFLNEQGCDVVFPVLHGSFGEDGTLQSYLEHQGMRFVGSGSEASRNAMDKLAAQKIFEDAQIMVPRSQVLIADVTTDLRFPVIVKPRAGGSSIGLFKLSSLDEYIHKKKEIFGAEEMMAQEEVIGREVTCGVIEMSGKEFVLPVTEIILKHDGLFDYQAKYIPNACEEITPAELGEELSKKIQAIALKCHRALGCKSISRTDMIVSPESNAYVLETNTLPGMTQTSFIPAQAAVAGISMQELVSTLIESAHL